LIALRGGTFSAGTADLDLTDRARPPWRFALAPVPPRIAWPPRRFGITTFSRRA
jgi:hypothetical protein